MSTTIDPFNPMWRSTPQFWSDEDVFKRWQDAMLALHELTHRVNDTGEVEEIKFDEDQEKRLHAALNFCVASCELVFRTLGKQIEETQDKLTEMQVAAQMQWEELQTITRALIPGAVVEDRLEN